MVIIWKAAKEENSSILKFNFFLYSKSSGIQVDQECVNVFNDFKMNKKIAFILFGFSDDNRMIKVRHVEPRTSSETDSIQVKSELI